VLLDDRALVQVDYQQLIGVFGGHEKRLVRAEVDSVRPTPLAEVDLSDPHAARHVDHRDLVSPSAGVLDLHDAVVGDEEP